MLPLAKELSLQPEPVPIVPNPKIDPKTGKPKPEMRDAVTQTDRSDYAIIKAKMMRERKEQEKLLLEGINSNKKSSDTPQ